MIDGARRLVLLVGTWRTWLIAALITSLVSVPVAGAATRTGRALAVGGYHPRALARAASAEETLAGTIVKQLALGAVSGVGSGVTSKFMGWVLDQYGLGDGTESEFAGIREKLGEIQNTLTELKTAVTKLQGDVAQSEYSILVRETGPITAAIDTGMRDLGTVANMTASNSTRRQKVNRTDETLQFIYANLVEKPAQLELARAISGEAGGDGLIKAFSKAIKSKSGCCWTDLTSNEVRKVFDYYQLEEARLLMLRVEYMHAHRNTYTDAEIKQQIRTVEQEVGTSETPGTQEALLKPSSPCCVAQDPVAQPGVGNSPSALIADPRTNLIWNTAYLGVKVLSWQAPYIEKAVRDRGGWRLATVREVQEFIRGWQESRDATNWEEWLYRLPQVNRRIPSITSDAPTEVFGYSYPSAGYTGVWTFRCPGCAQPTAVSATGAEESPPPGTNQLRGLLLVKDRTENYWW